MQLLSAFAIFFIIWWTVLFAVLPTGVRSQHEDEEAVLGTERGAPTSAGMRRKLVITTIIASVLFAAFYFLTVTLGYGIHSFPQFVPDFGAGR